MKVNECCNGHRRKRLDYIYRSELADNSCSCKRSLGACAVVFLTIVLVSLTGTTAGADPQLTNAHAPKNFKFLQTPPVIAHFPNAYSGQLKYKSIIERQNPKGVDYSITFVTKDTPDAVANWYRDALRQEGWKIAPSPATLALSARRKTADCTVTVMQSADKLMPTQVYVTYSEFGPVRD